jgi:hypothetical protein
MKIRKNPIKTTHRNKRVNSALREMGILRRPSLIFPRRSTKGEPIRLSTAAATIYATILEKYQSRKPINKMLSPMMIYLVMEDMYWFRFCSV